MRKAVKILAFMLVALSLFTSCLETDSPSSTSATTTTAQTEQIDSVPPSPSALKSMMLSAENITIQYSLGVVAQSQSTDVTIKREGNKIMIKKETTDKDGNWTYITRSTVYYDLENNDIYQHDKDGKFYVSQMEEKFDWQKTLFSYGVLLTSFGDVFNDDHYVWVEGGKYVAPEEVLKQLSERRGTAYKSMSATLGSTKSSIGCAMEGRSASLIVSFRKPGVSFPEAERVGSGVSGL